MKLDHTRFGLQAYAPRSDQSRWTKFPTGSWTKVILSVEVQLYSVTRRCPSKIVLHLCQVAVEEGSEPGRRAELQGAMFAGLRFEAPAGELVRCGWNHDPGGNFERRQQSPTILPVERNRPDSRVMWL